MRTAHALSSKVPLGNRVHRIAQGEQARAEIVNQVFARCLQDASADIEDKDARAIGRDHRHANSEQVRIPVAEGKTETVLMILLAGAQHTGTDGLVTPGQDGEVPGMQPFGGRASVSALLVEMIERNRKALELELGKTVR